MAGMHRSKLTHLIDHDHEHSVDYEACRGASNLNQTVERATNTGLAGRLTWPILGDTQNLAHVQCNSSCSCKGLQSC